MQRLLRAQGRAQGRSSASWRGCVAAGGSVRAGPSRSWQRRGDGTKRLPGPRCPGLATSLLSRQAVATPHPIITIKTFSRRRRRLQTHRPTGPGLKAETGSVCESVRRFLQEHVREYFISPPSLPNQPTERCHGVTSAPVLLTGTQNTEPETGPGLVASQLVGGRNSTKIQRQA